MPMIVVGGWDGVAMGYVLGYVLTVVSMLSYIKLTTSSRLTGGASVVRQPYYVVWDKRHISLKTRDVADESRTSPSPDSPWSER